MPRTSMPIGGRRSIAPFVRTDRLAEIADTGAAAPAVPVEEGPAARRRRLIDFGTEGERGPP
ncbi:MAG: hypothetical protein AMXMBFR83_07830 [Phycisphaerae bacterium]